MPIKGFLEEADSGSRRGSPCQVGIETMDLGGWGMGNPLGGQYSFRGTKEKRIEALDERNW